MRLSPTPEFWKEQEAFRLRYTCESCAFYDAPAGRCAHEWPNREHLEEWYRVRPSRIVFCKEFELA